MWGIYFNKFSELYKENEFFMNEKFFEKDFFDNLLILTKRYYYHERTNLFLRERISQLNNSDIKNLKDNFEILFELNNNNINDNNIIIDILNKINFRILPKNLEFSDNNNDKKDFISNILTSKNFYVKQVNYFIDAPIEVMILSMLWTITVGKLLDDELSEECYGNRINNNIYSKLNENIIKNISVFDYYVKPYNEWRDNAINNSLKNLENKNNILLIGLDIKGCFYYLNDKNPNQIDLLIEKKLIDKPLLQEKYKGINKIINMINFEYHKKIKNFLKNSHKIFDNTPLVDEGLPIGLPSSAVLANWRLKKFDDNIKKINYTYYGRYVDDILLCIPNPYQIEKCNDINSVISQVFIKNEILEIIKDDKEINKSSDCKKSEFKYKILDYDHLFIQSEKISIHYYRYDSDWSSLETFKEELKQQASEFRFLPERDENSVKFNINEYMFNGESNKFRNIIGIKENKLKLSNYLYKKILEVWLSNNQILKNDIEYLKRFFKGKNIFEFSIFWERFFTLLSASKNNNEIYHFYYLFLRTIEKISCSKCLKDSLEFQELIIKDLKNYLQISLLISISYLDEKNRKKFIDIFKINNSSNEKQFSFNDSKELDTYLISIRKNRYLRKQFIGWPLIDYLDDYYDLNLIKLDFSKIDNLNNNLSLTNIEAAPRFITKDEIILNEYLFKIKEYINDYSKQITPINSQKSFNNCNEELIEKEKVSNNEQEKSKENENSEKNDDCYSFKIKDINNKTPIKHNDQFIIGISNLKVEEKEYRNSYLYNEKPVLSLERQQKFFKLINESITKNKCDLIIFPEISVPVAWIPFITHSARRHQVGIVFGVEHWVINKNDKKIILNLVCTALPYIENDLNECFVNLRNKNHYSPSEIKEFTGLNYEIPQHEKSEYPIFDYRNCVFTVFNCFEVTDIKDRSKFRANIDLFITIAYNRDKNYFSNIMESVTRDLHCYVAYANTSNYGDSMLIHPKETALINKIRVTGGLDPVLLKDKLEIRELREFQTFDSISDKKEFKPLPAGFNKMDAINRNMKK